MEINVPDIILSTFHLELTLKHIEDLCTFCCQIWICIERFLSSSFQCQIWWISCISSPLNSADASMTILVQQIHVKIALNVVKASKLVHFENFLLLFSCQYGCLRQRHFTEEEILEKICT